MPYPPEAHTGRVVKSEATRRAWIRRAIIWQPPFRECPPSGLQRVTVCKQLCKFSEIPSLLPSPADIPHVLPERFVRIRDYGLLANRHREKALALCNVYLLSRGARTLCTSPGLYGIIVSTKSRFRRLGMRQIPSLDGPRKPHGGLWGGCGGPQGVARRGLRRIESP